MVWSNTPRCKARVRDIFEPQDPQICFRGRRIQKSLTPRPDWICRRSGCSSSSEAMASPNSDIPIRVSDRSLPPTFPQASSSCLRLHLEVRFKRFVLFSKFGVLAPAWRGAASRRVRWGIGGSGYPASQGTLPSWRVGSAVSGSSSSSS